MKRHLEDTTKRAFKSVDDELVMIKSSLMSLCTEIDRYFRAGHQIEIREEIDDDILIILISRYPSLSSFTPAQFKRLLNIFLKIRNINAHLYLNKPIMVDDELIEKLISVCEPKFRIHCNNELTVYGCFYILMFLSKPFMIWPATTSFLNNKLFYEVPNKGDERSVLQINNQKAFQRCCGIGKPIINTIDNQSKGQVQYLSDTIKRCLTTLFFDLEKILFGKSIAYKWHSPSFRQFVSSNPYLNKEDTVAKISKLRNVWLHGYLLNDDYNDADSNFIVTLQFIIDSLMIFKTELPDEGIYRIIHDDLDAFSTSLFHFCALRVVEVGYKLLDSRLLTEDKLEERIKNIRFALDNLTMNKPSFYENLGLLLRNDEIVWKVGASKFTDKLPRQTICKTLDLIEIHSENGLTFGNYYSDVKDIVVPNIYLSFEFKNLINGRPLDDYLNDHKSENYYSKYFRLIKA